MVESSNEISVLLGIPFFNNGRDLREDKVGDYVSILLFDTSPVCNTMQLLHQDTSHRP